jgi:hypothetical protein
MIIYQLKNGPVHLSLALKQTALFDTITAQNEQVTVTQSQEPNHEHFSGTRYEAAGEYNYTTYYDQQGHWQGMAFDRKGLIEFRCVDCKNTLWADMKETDVGIDHTKAQLLSYP